MHKVNLAKELILCGREPIYFIERYCKIATTEHGIVPFKLFEFQRKCIHDFLKNRYNIINKARQLGISSLIASYAIWYALFFKGKSILIIATKEVTAKNLLKKIKTIIDNMPPDMFLAKITTRNQHTLEFSNGSTIKAVPTSPDAGRSEAASLLIVDEAAHIDNMDELWAGILPTIATGGKCILASSPNGVGNFFHKTYMGGVHGTNNFFSKTLHWTVHPDRDAEWFENETKNMSKRKIAQEYEAEFLTSGDTFVQAEDISYVSSIVCDPRYKDGIDRNLWIWQDQIPDEKYIIGADIARGDGKDFSTLSCMRASTWEIVAEYKGKLQPDVFGTLLNEVGKKYNNALLAPENNKFDTTIYRLRELNYPNLFVEKKRNSHLSNTSMGILFENNTMPGFNTSSHTRPMVLQKLEEVIRNKILKVYSMRFADELKTFQWINGKQQAIKDANDDLIVSTAIACWLNETTFTVNIHDRNMAIAMLNGMSKTSRSWSDANGTGKDMGTPIQTDNLSSYPLRYDPRSGTSKKVDFTWLIKR